jgi:hypothetical protein
LYLFRQTTVPKQNYHGLIAAKTADFLSARELHDIPED